MVRKHHSRRAERIEAKLDRLLALMQGGTEPLDAQEEAQLRRFNEGVANILGYGGTHGA